MSAGGSVSRYVVEDTLAPALAKFWPRTPCSSLVTGRSVRVQKEQKFQFCFFSASLQRSSGKSGDRAQTNALRSTCAAVVGLVGACAQVRDALRRGALLGIHSAPRPKKCGYRPTIARVHARCTVIANRGNVRFLQRSSGKSGCWKNRQNAEQPENSSVAAAG